MAVSQRLIVATFKAITHLVCRIDDIELDKVPQHGPLIIYTNHVNILEIPIIYTQLQPRRVHGMLLAERWKNPVLRWILDSAETIPLHRATADHAAIRKGLDILRRGETIIISPEGTRSHDGKLSTAQPGAVLLALLSKAPLLPLVYFGAEHYKEKLRHLRRTDFHIKVGRCFRLDVHGEKSTHLVRQKILEEMMYQLANLLPTQYRGRYADTSCATQKFLVFSP